MGGRLRTLTYAAVLAVIVGHVLAAGREIFVPVVIAVMLVYVILGVARLIGRASVAGRRLPEWAELPVATVLILIVAGEVGALLLGSLGAVASRAPVFQDSFLAALQQAAAALGVEREPTWEAFRADLIGGMDLQATLRSAALSTTALLGVQVVVLLNVAFILLERRSFEAKLGLLFDDPARTARLRALVADINGRVSRYLAVKTLINVVLGLVSWVIMLAFGVEFAALWALLIGLFNYIPYVGSFVGVAFPVALALAQFGDVGAVLSLALALGAAQVLMGNVIEPRVMGGALNLSPWVVLLSLTVWSSLWGVAGAVVSAPITAIMVVVFAEFASTRPLAVLLSQHGEIPDRIEDPKPLS